MGTIINSSTGRFDYEVYSWEDDTGSRCTWDSGDESRAWQYGLGYPTSYSASKWQQIEKVVEYNDTKFRMKHTWRYSNGQYASTALDFGTMTSGSKNHSNSNRSAPDGASSSMGYGDTWKTSPFRPGNDVTYKFRLETAQKVIISTDNPETDFDTHIHLVRFNEAGTLYWYIAGDDDSGFGTKSLMTKDLCPDYYGIIVEGHNTNYVGDFKLSVAVVPLDVTAGTIAINGPTEICPNTTLPAINNTVSATSTLGGITYSWEKLTHDGSNWSSWSTISGSGSSNSSLGNMGSSKYIGIRRKATDCGSSSYTNSVYYYQISTAISGGSISGSKTIPFPHEKSNGVLTSGNDASASPSSIISWEKSEDGGGWQTIAGATSQSYTLSNSIPKTTKYRRKVKSSCTNPEVAAYSVNELEIKVINPNGIISGVVLDRNGGTGIQGINITATRNTAVPGGQTDKEYTAVTGNGGTFDIGGVYYGDIAPGSGATANFTVVPSKTGHGFDPGTALVTVSQNIPVPSDLEFRDTTGFVIAGTVIQECFDCIGGTPSVPVVYPMPDVTLLNSASVNAVPTDNQTTTGKDGKYATIKQFEGDYIIKPEFETHEFRLHQETVEVGGSIGVLVDGIDFVDTTTHVISGNVIINCSDFYIGRAQLTFSQVLPDFEGSPVAPTFQKIVTAVAGSGAYSVRLPAAKYKVSVNSFTDVPTGKDLNSLEMVAFLNAYPDSIRVRDITNSDTTMNLYFHEKPQIQVIGLAGPNCAGGLLAGSNDLSANPIFVQSEPRTFTVKVWEGNKSKGCPAQDSTLIINTNIQVDDVNEPQIDTMTVDGEIELTLTGGVPNIIPPHHKTLAFVFTDIWLRAAENVVLTPVVTGIKANIGSFATVSPEVPILILRDPPGDESYSFWSQDNTIETATRFYSRKVLSGEVWGKVKVGVETENGIGVSVKSKVWGELGGSLITTATINKSEEVVLSTTNSEAFSTSNSASITGEKGDVYIGAAMNLKYAVTNEVIYAPDTCSFYLKKFLMISNEGFQTKYIYSENHILNTLIPTLRTFRDNAGNTPAEKANFVDQISVWQQIVENNKELKRKAKFIENISFDGAGGQITSSTTASKKGTSSIEFGLEIDAGIAEEVGLESAGAGVSGGVKIRFKMETGKAKITSNTTGYTMGDSNSGDFFTVDIKSDPVYGTPVFDLVAGTSSCPTEPGTQPRDEISLTAPDPVQVGIAAAATGYFPMYIGNTSQSEEARTYWLRHINGSGTGATITNEGNPFIIPFQYDLNYLQKQTVIVGVSRFNQNVYGFENIRFEAIDACQGKDASSPFSRKEVSISAFFANGCSPITLAAPENGFVVSQSNNNLLGVTMTDYNHANLDEIVVEYAKVGTSNWKEAVTLPKTQILNSSFGTQLNVNVAGIADGAYSFRLKLKCGLNVIYSQRATGVFDREGPESFGVPQPADDVYSLGDEISQSFTETLGCSALNASNFTMTRLSNSSAIPAVLGCFENKIILTPTIDILAFLGDSIAVNLTNIADNYGNPATADFAWKFNIGSPEIDATIPFYAQLNSASAGFGTSSNNNIFSTPTSINEDDAGTINVDFSVSQVPNDSILVYFIVAGTATYGVDYTVSGAQNFNGNEGSIYIPKFSSTAELQINPTADSDLESDESIILGILSGGDYNIGSSNKITLTIINDDSDDCENGGLAYVQNNNTLGNTSLEAGEYHKLLLESDGLVTSPTTVIFRGEKSITLQPGFEVQSGSVFIASQEDCPNPSIVTGNTGGEKGARVASARVSASSTPTFATYAVENTSVLDESQTITQVIDKDGKVLIPFASAMSQAFEITLLTTRASVAEEFSGETVYASGLNTFSLETNDLATGTYFLRFKGLKDQNESYHKLIVAENL